MATEIEEILLRVRAELGEAQAGLASLGASLEGLDHKTATANAGVNVAKGLADVAALSKSLDKLDGRKATANANVNTAAAEAAVAQLEFALKDLDGKNVKIDANLDTAAAEANAAQLKMFLGALSEGKYTAHVDFDSAAFQAELAAIDAELAALTSKDVSVPVKLEGEEALGEAMRLNLELDAALTGKEVPVHIDAKRALVEARTLNGVLDSVLGNKNDPLQAFINGLEQVGSEFGNIAGAAGGAKGPLDNVGVSIGNMSFRLGAAAPLVLGLAAAIIGSLVSALGMLVASAGAAVTALGALAVAAGAALGPVLVLGIAIVSRLTKVLGAKKAQDQQAAAQAKDTASADRSAAAAAEQRRAASNALRDAQQNLATAERELGDARKKAQQDIANAVKSEKDAHRTTVEALHDEARAAGDVKDARVAAAHAIKAAQQDAKGAEVDYARTVRDGYQQIADAQQNVRDAQAKVADEVVNANKAIAQSFKDVRDATLNVKEAQLSLEEAKNKVADLEAEFTNLKKTAPDALKKLSDVDLRGFTPGQFGITGSDADTAIKLRDKLLALEKAKLDVEKATNNLTDSEDNLSTAQKTNTDYVENGINAYKPYTDALKGVDEANKSLAETNTRVAETIKDAAAKMAEAEKTAADLEKQGINGSSQVQAAKEQEHNARLRVVDARERETEAEKKLQDLQRAGVAGAPGVISAQERLRDALEAVAEAHHRVGTAGQEALSGPNNPTAAAYKAARATDALDASELRLLKNIRLIIAAFRDMTKGGVDAFFDGVSKAIKIMLPVMKKLAPSFTELGIALGFVATAMAEELARPENVEFFKRLIHASSQLVIILGSDAFISFFRIIRNIADAAMPLLIAGAQAFAELLRKWAKSTNDVGSLRGIIADFIPALSSILKLIGSVSDMFFQFFRVVSPIGNKFVDFLAQSAQHLADFMKSGKGAKDVQNFFKDTRPLAQELLKTIGNLLVIFLQVFGRFAPLIAPVIRIFNTLLGAVIKMNQAWINATRPIAEFISNGIKILGDALDWVINKVTGFFTALMTGGQTARTAVKNLADGVVSIIKTIGGAFKDAGDWAISQFTGALQNGIAIIGGVGDWISAAFTDSLHKVKGAFSDAGNWILDRLSEGIEKVGGLFATTGGWIKDRFFEFIKGEIAGFKTVGNWIVDRLSDGIKAVGGVVKDAAGWVKDRFVDFVHNEIQGFKNIGGWILNRLVDGVKGIASVISDVAGWIRARFGEFIHNEVEGFSNIGNWILNRLIDGFKAAVNVVTNAAGWLKDQIVGFVHDRLEFFQSLGDWVVGGIIGGFKNAGERVVSAAEWLKDKVVGFIHDRINALTDAGSWVLGKIIDGMLNAPKEVFNRLKDFVDKIINKVKDLLGIHSPSKVFEEIGHNMAAGLVRGFGADDVAGFVKNNLGSLTSLAPKLIGEGIIDIADLPADAFDKFSNLFDDLFGGDAGPYLGNQGGSLGSKGYDGHPATNNPLLDLAARIGHALGLTVTATTDHSLLTDSGNISNHTRGLDGVSHAVDMSNGYATEQERRYFLRILKTFGHRLRELFHTPMGYSIKNGQRTAPISAKDHYNHVHVALAKGGLVTGRTFAEIGEGRDDEAVLPLNRLVYKQLAEGIIGQLRIQQPSFNLTSISGTTQPTTPAVTSSTTTIERVVLPPVAADQNGFDGRQGAALLMQELRARGMGTP